MDKTLNLFLDSNIWLDLFHFSSNDLEEFSKLKNKINKEIKLFIPNQVIYEIRRNRDSKISDAYKKFQNINIEIPNLCKGYDEYITFKTIYSNLKQLHKDLVNRVSNDIVSKKLPADKLINELVNQATKIIETQEIITNAELRCKRGNPPGKNNSLGDAINWETLLKKVPNSQDLYFISGDKDYKNQFSDVFNTFLNYEWENTKKSKIYFYTSLEKFFNLHQVDIELKTEKEKTEMINLLACSDNFRATHEIIYKLNSYEYFSDEQLNQLISIASSNGQVRAILKDNDLYSFYHKIIKGRLDKIELNEDTFEVLKKLGVLKYIEQKLQEDEDVIGW